MRSCMAAWFIAAATLAGCGDSGTNVALGARLAVSSSQVCALLTTGVYCWEADFDDNGANVVEAPTRVELNASDVVELAAASGRACVRRRTGRVECWGANDQGQIGDGTRVSSPTPVPVTGIHDALQLAVDTHSTCVLHADHSVSCWGRSPQSSPESGSLLPRTIPQLSGVVELRGGGLDSYCARRDDGSVSCTRFREGAWTVPQTVESLQGATAIALTFEDTVCGIVASTEVRCSHLDTQSTLTLSESAGSRQLRASGGLSACAQSADAAWHCWNVMPTANDSAGTPRTSVTSDVPLVDLGISGFLTCGMSRDGSVLCAAANSGPTELRSVPLPR